MLSLLRVSTGSGSEETKGGAGGGSTEKAISFFDYLQIFPGSKTTHFAKIHEASGIEYEDMLFFDDEARNRNVETLGVVMLLVRDGVTRDEVDRGVELWRKRNKKA